MTTETEQTTMTDNAITEFGAQLKAAREAQGLERKDVAAQLRLNERFIVMMENGEFSTDVPLMFIRGYLRAYSKLLHLPADASNQALEALKPQPVISPLSQMSAESAVVTSKNYSMQLVTSLVVATLMTLVGTWWYSHSPTPTDSQTLQVGLSTNQQPINLPLNNNEPNKSTPAADTKLADAAPVNSAADPLVPTIDNTPTKSADTSAAKQPSTEDASKKAVKANSDSDHDEEDDETESND